MRRLWRQRGAMAVTIMFAISAIGVLYVFSLSTGVLRTRGMECQNAADSLATLAAWRGLAEHRDGFWIGPLGWVQNPDDQLNDLQDTHLGLDNVLNSTSSTVDEVLFGYDPVAGPNGEFGLLWAQVSVEAEAEWYVDLFPVDRADGSGPIDGSGQHSATARMGVVQVTLTDVHELTPSFVLVLDYSRSATVQAQGGGGLSVITVIRCAVLGQDPGGTCPAGFNPGNSVLNGLTSIAIGASVFSSGITGSDIGGTRNEEDGGMTTIAPVRRVDGSVEIRGAPGCANGDRTTVGNELQNQALLDLMPYWHDVCPPSGDCQSYLDEALAYVDDLAGRRCAGEGLSGDDLAEFMAFSSVYMLVFHDGLPRDRELGGGHPQGRSVALDVAGDLLDHGVDDDPIVDAMIAVFTPSQATAADPGARTFMEDLVREDPDNGNEVFRLTGGSLPATYDGTQSLFTEAADVHDILDAFTDHNQDVKCFSGPVWLPNTNLPEPWVEDPIYAFLHDPATGNMISLSRTRDRDELNCWFEGTDFVCPHRFFIRFDPTEPRQYWVHVSDPMCDMIMGRAHDGGPVPNPHELIIRYGRPMSLLPVP